MKQLFLPLGLLLAILAALIVPACGLFISEHNGLRIFVFIIFLISGYQTGSDGLKLNRHIGRILLVAACISLILSPLLGLLVTRLIDFPQTLAIGLIITCAVPPTLSSGVVITEVSRGNTVLALLLTVAINLLGIFTLPYMLDFCLKLTGPIDIDQTGLLLKMLFLILLPFAVGKLIRMLRKISSVSGQWSYVNSSCVILVVYSSLAVSKNEFLGLDLRQYAMILGAVSLIHLLLIIINAQAGKLLGMPMADRKAMIFVTSQKTLPIALAVLANINFDTGSAIIVCLMFHFFQLFADSFIAVWLQTKRGGHNGTPLKFT